MMKPRIIQIIDYLLLTVLGIFCVRYSLYDGRLFAEQRVEFPCLNFPIFVGEFLLAGCLILFLIKWCLAKVPLNKWHYLIIGYFCFMMVKALLGYVHWGPLALRDAALFYYFAFALIAYYAYRSEYFNRAVILFCYGVLIWMFFVPKFNDFWYLGRMALGLVLAYSYPDRRIGSLMAVGIIIFSPHRYFLETNRTIILANFLAVSYLIITSTFLLNRDIRRQILLGGVVFIVGLGLYMFHFSGYIPAQTIFKWTKIAEEFKKLDDEVQEKKTDFKRENPVARPHIYNAEKTIKSEQAVLPASEERIPIDSSAVPVQEVPPVAEDPTFLEGQKIGNSLFRLLIWRDVAVELSTSRPVFGFDFGKPFLAVSLLIIRSGIGEWERDGWISIHNAFFNIIYRAGLVGVVFILTLGGIFVYMTKIFIRTKSFPGLLLCATILGWFVAANFAVILELPYNAIPIWVLCGLTLAYAHRQAKKA